jgi:hypothetical protein
MNTEQELLPSPSWNNHDLWSKMHTRHGHAVEVGGKKASPTYTSWLAMRVRCKHRHRDPSAKYVNRGITFDPAWDSFEQFLADMGERPAGTTLDRIDNDRGYSAANCRWATPTQQSRNNRHTRLTYEKAVEIALARHMGERPKDIAARYGISESLPREIAKGRVWKDANAEALEIIACQNS